MNQIQHFDSLPVEAEDLFSEITLGLSEKNFEFRPSFNLRHARMQQKDYPCFYHGTANCSCQMIVLQIYQPVHQNEGPPVTVVLYGQDHHTRLSFIEDQDNPPGDILQQCLDIVLERVRSLIKKKGNRST